jgi:hypothetical protein
LSDAEKAAAEAAAAKAKTDGDDAAGGDDKKGPDLGYLPPETEPEKKPDMSAADALADEQKKAEAALADDASKDEKIAFLEGQLQDQKAKVKEVRVQTEAAKAVRECFDTYPYADPDIVKAAFEEGKHANEITRLAKVTHFAVKKVRDNADTEAIAAADARAAKLYGTPAPTGKTSSGGLSAKEFAKLPRAEQLRRAKDVRRTDRAQL